MHRGEVTHDRQAEAESALRAPARRVALLESLEDSGQDLGRDADAGIAHLDGDRVRLRARGDVDPAALRSELDGVGDQVRDDLLQARRPAPRGAGPVPPPPPHPPPPRPGGRAADPPPPPPA